MRKSPLLILAAGSLLAGVVTGCGPRAFETEADLLRAQVLQLEDEVRGLERRETELRAELRRALRAQERREDLADPDIGEFVPHVIEIRLGRLSHARDTTRDGLPDTLLLYVDPIDSRGRFTQLVGEVLVNAVVLPEAEDAITIARARLRPGEVRDAYRTGITGTHYAVQVPISPPAEIDPQWLIDQQAIVRVTYLDGQTGLRHTAERAIHLQP